MTRRHVSHIEIEPVAPGAINVYDDGRLVFRNLAEVGGWGPRGDDFRAWRRPA